MQPICSNCTTAGLVCDYGSRLLSATRRTPLLGARAQSLPTTPAPGGTPLESPAGYQPVNMLHVELFHNLHTQIRTVLDPNRSIAWLADDVAYLVTTPYLVNELLAFSALHLSTTRPDRREYYRYHAAQLQTQALSIFKESSPQVTQETCIPLFVFAVSLGIHTLCDTLIYREGHFANFLDRFVHFFRLYYGVRTIVDESWHMIQDTPLASSFNIGTDLYRFNGHLGPVCQTLLSLINRANLGKELTDIYRQAIESLQSCLKVIEDRSELHVGINAVTTWPILIRIEFAELIEQRRPEAMVILAHYACTLHLFRDIWLFGDSGAFIIREVTGYLGPEWDEWMAWPNQMLRSSPST
ncbi:C6 finger domain protein [Aspergillus tubingensis]|uniref:C6 finger domain protein n=1 Tax=Aspergillus tubingensis TaxID=5068 RepID=UPI001577A8D3|nr:C6 finger domain protein [Aspergillus tubingensis]GFN20334.1 C6 finger domain protein [Aspergillus tubingensis]